ncbi:uncharacterized protein LOC128208143 isoform X2 [Mya arenaria]|uniref:uncharacterized protein LOC128208143 isoform X2 n=1 Tax=Mya arenaria TaxID=6604 RepID=UPI0022E67F12|nr:uncharacterized protein LOC128208143 isoform X2 [Mya arenaria]
MEVDNNTERLNGGGKDEVDGIVDSEQACDSGDMLKKVHDQLNDLNSCKGVNDASKTCDSSDGQKQLGLKNGVDISLKENTVAGSLNEQDKSKRPSIVDEHGEIKSGCNNNVENLSENSDSANGISVDHVKDDRKNNIESKNNDDQHKKHDGYMANHDHVNPDKSIVSEDTDEEKRGADDTMESTLDETYEEMSDEASVSTDNVDDKSLSVSTGEKDGHVIMSIHKKKAKNKRKRKSDMWSKPNPFISKRLRSRTSTGEGEGGENKMGQDGDPVNTEPGTDQNETSTPDEKRRRSAVQSRDFVVGDDSIIDEMLAAEDSKKFGSATRKKFQPIPKTLSDAEMEKFREPFKHGWKREVVFRATTVSRSQAADVYYFPPVGSKLRSMVQVADWLSSHDTPLTVDNFTFMRRAIGVGEGETVRNANRTAGRINPTSSKSSNKSSPSFKLVKRPSRAPPKHYEELIHDDNDGQYDTPEIVIERDSVDFVSQIMSGIADEEKNETEEMEGIETTEMVYPSKEAVIVSPSQKKFKSTARKSTTQKHFKKVPIPYTGVENLCSMGCPGMEGIPPMLHCNVCMCLFHNECVNYFGESSDFICLRCKDEPPGLMGPSSVSSQQGKTVMLKVSNPHQMSPYSNSKIISVRRVATVGHSPGPSGSKSPGFQVTKLVSMASNGSPFVINANGTIGNVNPALPVFTKIINASTRPSSPATATRPIMSTTKIVTSSSAGSNMQNKLSEIQPIIKQEPPDDSTDNTNKSCQASNKALSSLKAALNTKRLDALPQKTPQNIPFSIQNERIQMPKVTTVFPPLGVQIMNQAIQAGRSVVNTTPNMLNIMPMNQTMRAVAPRMVLPRLPQVVTVPPPPRTMMMTNHGVVLSPQLVSPQLVSPQLTPDASNSGPVVINAKQVSAPMNGQLLTLPQAVSKRLTLNKALALKINNVKITVPPSGFFQSSEGLKVFLPPNTFPTVDETDLNVSVSNEVKSGEDSAQTSSDKPESRAVSSSKKKDIRELKLYKKCCLLQSLYGGFNAMEHIFKQLSLIDLLKVGKVCRTWRKISMLPSLWSHVDFKDCMVADWQAALQFISSRHVRSISLKGIVHHEDANRTWQQLLSGLQGLDELRRVTFGLIPSALLQSMCSRLGRLQALTADEVVEANDQASMYVPTKLDVSKFSSMMGLEELRVRGKGGIILPSFSFSGGLSDLGILRKLTVLHLTSLKNVKGSEFSFISLLSELTDLALGDCKDWTQETYGHLQKLTGLHRLRLEHGGAIPDLGLGMALSHMNRLEWLELINYTLAYTFGNHVSDLTSLKHLYILPDSSNFASHCSFLAMAAEVNTNTLAAAEKLGSLKTFTWVVEQSAPPSIILEDEETIQQVLIPVHVPNVNDESKDVTKLQYLSKEDLLKKLKAILPDTEVLVKVEKQPGVQSVVL